MTRIGRWRGRSRCAEVVRARWFRYLFFHRRNARDASKRRSGSAASTSSGRMSCANTRAR
jgi:hypothetical protein